MVVVHAVGAVFVRFILGGTGGDGTFPVIVSLQSGTDGGVIGDSLGNDVHCTLQCVIRGSNALFFVHILGSHFLRRSHARRLHHQHICQRLQTAFLGDRRTGATLGAIGAVHILQLGQGHSIVQGELQLLGPDLQLFKGFADLIAALLNIAQRTQSVRNIAQLLIIQRAMLLLAITRDKGQRCTLVQQGDDCLHLPGLNGKLFA